MRTLAIDLSLNKFGYVTFDDDKLNKELSGKIYDIEKCYPEQLDRIEYTKEFFESFIEENNIQHIIIETPLSQHSKTKMQTLFSLFGVNLIIQMMIRKRNIKYDMIHPVSWRSHIAKKYNLDRKKLSKELSIVAAKQIVDFDLEEDDDICDAICMWQYVKDKANSLP